VLYHFIVTVQSPPNAAGVKVFSKSFSSLKESLDWVLSSYQNRLVGLLRL